MHRQLTPPARAPARHGACVAPRRGVACVAASSPPSVTITVTSKDSPARSITAESGDQLRAVLMADKVDLYTTWGKVWQCGGAGQCGTCIVEVREGAELLSARTAVENKKLSGKPATWRLACQTLVGDGETGGAVTIATKPQ